MLRVDRVGSEVVWAAGGVAVVGIFAYRVLALLMPMPISLAALPTLRAMGERPTSHAAGTAESANEPALQRGT